MFILEYGELTKLCIYFLHTLIYIHTRMLDNCLIQRLICNDLQRSSTPYAIAYISIWQT